MKKIITILALVFFYINANAQIITSVASGLPGELSGLAIDASGVKQ